MWTAQEFGLVVFSLLGAMVLWRLEAISATLKECLSELKTIRSMVDPRNR